MAKHTAEGIIAFVGKETGDGRLFETMQFRTFPLTLRAVFADIPGAHANAVPVGKIVEAEVKTNGDVFGKVEFQDTAHGRYAARLVDDEVLPGISIDGADVQDFQIRLEVVDEDGNVVNVDPFSIPSDTFDEMRWRVRTVFETVFVAAATLVATPAFGDARLRYTGEGFEDGEGDAPEAAPVAEIRAGVLPVYPARAFERRKFDKPTPLDFEEFTDADGREWAMVFGHLAEWDKPHVLSAKTGKPIVLRRNDFEMNSHYNLGMVMLDDGTKIGTGYMTCAAPHLDQTERRVTARKRAMQLLDHYDRSDLGALVLHCYADEHGPAVVGIVNPEATESQIAQAMQCPPSVHTLKLGGVTRLCGILSVPVPGFPIARGDGDGITEIAASFMGMAKQSVERIDSVAASIESALEVNALDAAFFGR